MNVSAPILSLLSVPIHWMRTTLGTLLLAAVAAALCGIFVHDRGFVILCGLLAAILLGMAWPWLSLRALSGTVRFDRRRISEGETAQLRLAIRNRWALPVWGVSIRGVLNDLDDADSPLLILPAWRTTEVSLNLAPKRRGEYPRSTPRMVCGFPFGLWFPWKPVHVENRLVVWPKTVAVAPVPQTAGRFGEEHSFAQNRPGNGGDLLGVRPYRRGDPLRLIHWNQTARQDRLIVNEMQDPVRSRICIVVDVNPAAYDDLSPESPREWAIRIAASLFIGWLDQGAAVGMAVAGQSFSVLPSARNHRNRVLDALARISDSGCKPIGDLLEARSTGAFIVLISSDRAVGAEQVRSALRGARWIVLPPRWSLSEEENCMESWRRAPLRVQIPSPQQVESQLCSW